MIYPNLRVQKGSKLKFPLVIFFFVLGGILIFFLINKYQPNRNDIYTTPGRCDCSQSLNPVCGKDYLNYENECLADCVGVQVAYPGRCKQFNPTSAQAGCKNCDLTCEEGEVLYADKNGCAVCECQPMNMQWGASETYEEK